MFAVVALLVTVVSAALIVHSPEEMASANFGHDSLVQTPLAISETGTRVPILLGVMSRCPDALLCESLFDGVLQQTWDIVNISLSFLGTVNSSDTEYGVTCKHGSEECAGNVQELCAMSHTKSQQKWWQFLQCLNYEGRGSVGDQSLAQRCAGMSNIPWENQEFNGTSRKGIKGCIEGHEGRELLKVSVEQSKDLGIEKSCTIMISGIQRCVHDGTWKDCETGHTVEELVSYIQEEHQRLQNNGTANSEH